MVQIRGPVSPGCVAADRTKLTRRLPAALVLPASRACRHAAHQRLVARSVPVRVPRELPSAGSNANETAVWRFVQNGQAPDFAELVIGPNGMFGQARRLNPGKRVRARILGFAFDHGSDKDCERPRGGESCSSEL